LPMGTETSQSFRIAAVLGLVFGFGRANGHPLILSIFFDEEKKRVRSENLFMIGRMAAPDWYCRTRDRFELVRPRK